MISEQEVKTAFESVKQLVKKVTFEQEARLKETSGNTFLRGEALERLSELNKVMKYLEESQKNLIKMTLNQKAYIYVEVSPSAINHSYINARPLVAKGFIKVGEKIILHLPCLLNLGPKGELVDTFTTEVSATKYLKSHVLAKELYRAYMINFGDSEDFYGIIGFVPLGNNEFEIYVMDEDSEIDRDEIKRDSLD